MSAASVLGQLGVSTVRTAECDDMTRQPGVCDCHRTAQCDDRRSDGVMPMVDSPIVSNWSEVLLTVIDSLTVGGLD